MTEKIAVYPNPWGVSPFLSREDAISANVADYDEDGAPDSLCVDFSRIVASRTAWIGAEIDTFEVTHAVSPEEARSRHPIRVARQKTKFKFLGVPSTAEGFADKLANAKAVEVELSPGVIHAIRNGQLIVADARAARRVGVQRIASAALFNHLASVHAAIFKREFDISVNGFVESRVVPFVEPATAAILTATTSVGQPSSTVKGSK